MDEAEKKKRLNKISAMMLENNFQLNCYEHFVSKMINDMEALHKNNAALENERDELLKIR